MKTNQEQMLQRFFQTNLLTSHPYKLEKSNAQLKLDQNEAIHDWPLLTLW